LNETILEDCIRKLAGGDDVPGDITLSSAQVVQIYHKTHHLLPEYFQFISSNTYRFDTTNMLYTSNQIYANTSAMAHARQVPQMVPWCMVLGIMSSSSGWGCFVSHISG